jgi:hypothetical protein
LIKLGLSIEEEDSEEAGKEEGDDDLPPLEEGGEGESAMETVD